MFKQGDIIENQLGNIFTVEDVGKRFYTLSEYGKKSVLSVLTIEYVNEMFNLKSNEENEITLSIYDENNEDEEEIIFFVYMRSVHMVIGKTHNKFSINEAKLLYKMLEKTYNF